MKSINKRKKIFGNVERPRLNVYKSLKHIHAQIIDDDSQKTIVGLSTQIVKKGNKMERSVVLGKEIAKRAKEEGVTKVVFDRGKFKYHGRIKAFADAAREGGLNF
ncbi:50S ribosomal protein L18 [candidate division WOR-1 bacterium RIFOXYD2_FULL_36_8]|uniref:Large ribosomal subunit protein uL18 n=1 Tax=candidate division WOR-1 bacterium RIFOXYB2_FULL_36_35 TaxID=1802578 RepID=A0A1F4S578_UNCSA|nr:MAG: 50S ribosomal protein L18 [candidate division WOR-1 bacterium RIFOXYA2_FULL_36_21]OGC15517.1 MAG: 50S ribosomal protein L18 [candidate division WOR-1 bacterium RIFOXYB2_FULL_36_35]OGC21302.1 MAG: 50S ribosomal protein L18 [candidate division WOR-1 bacterium RIFOXYA12_FULL_36_13]OGC38401.1 MAG: 50S ribosomal protein L18 [candidate division WOR-1 bacterium RIFOXYD2_FULL_36_8]